MKIFWNKNYNHNLPKNHKFPMEKYDLLPKMIIKDNIASKDSFLEPNEMDESIIKLVHKTDYINKIKHLQLSNKEERVMGFPQSNELLIREKTIMQGTLDASISALENHFTFNIAGGTHHAFSNKAEGFCIFNDQAIAAKYLVENTKVEKVLICDLDVHQGNGTAEIFKGEDRIFTFSMHARDNYPSKKEISDLDIPLSHDVSDQEYLDLLKHNLQMIIDDFKPDFIFYQSGVDILETDKFGRLKISYEACKERDRTVLETAYKKGLPLATSMGGGYSKDINIIVEAHLEVYRIAKRLLNF